MCCTNQPCQPTCRVLASRNRSRSFALLFRCDTWHSRCAIYGRIRAMRVYRVVLYHVITCSIRDINIAPRVDASAGVTQAECRSTQITNYQITTCKLPHSDSSQCHEHIYTHVNSALYISCIMAHKCSAPNIQKQQQNKREETPTAVLLQCFQTPFANTVILVSSVYLPRWFCCVGWEEWHNFALRRKCPASVFPADSAICSGEPNMTTDPTPT